MTDGVQPHEVFTPRAAEVNEEMYIDRPELEGALRQAVRRSLHSVLHGESGSGKSWLYKRVFSEEGVPYMLGNLANASRLGSVNAELQNLVDRQERARKTGYSSATSGGVDWVVKGAQERTVEYEIGEKEPFEAALEILSAYAGGRESVLVLDNLEAIFGDDEMMKELADLITLLDDARYAQYKAKLLLVGVPARVREYFAKTPARSTVANRLTELPEVARLTKPQVEELVRRGFVEKLGYAEEGADLDEIVEHISWSTDRVPQSVHEYGLELAYIAQERGGLLEADMLELADSRWLEAALANCYTAIQDAMNVRETKAGRRNQTLFALGKVESDDFRTSDVERIVRREFPESTEGKTLNIGGILSNLSSREPPIIKRSVKGDTYLFSDPRYRMGLRAMLRKQPDETVTRIDMGGMVPERNGAA